MALEEYAHGQGHGDQKDTKGHDNGDGVGPGDGVVLVQAGRQDDENEDDEEAHSHGDKACAGNRMHCPFPSP